MRSALRLMTLASALVLSACSSFEPADPSRATRASAPPALVWPERDVEVLHKYASLTPREYFGLKWIDGADRSKATREDHYLTSNPDLIVTHKGVYGLALLRMYDDRRAVTRPQDHARLRAFADDRLGFTPNASIITSRGLTADRAAVNARQLAHKCDFENLIRRKDGKPTRLNPTYYTSRLLDGMNLRIPPRSDTPIRGLIFHFHSLQANPGERAVMEEMTSRGWAVVDFQTDCRIDTPVKEENREKLTELDHHAIFAWSVATRGIELPGPDGVTQHLVMDEPLALLSDWKDTVNEAAKLREGAFTLNASTDTTALGEEIARLADDAIASNAYAAESVMLFLREHREDLLGGPLVLMGFSAGSLVTPAAAARLMQMNDPPRIDAVVLIGAGADLFLLSQKSTLTDGGVTLADGKKKPARELVERVHTAYRGAVRLDPCVSAEYLRTTPVLQVHASRDEWVPHEGGEILYEALGEPDRLTVRAGHIRLFYTLGLHDEEVAAWVEAHAPAVK